MRPHAVIAAYIASLTLTGILCVLNPSYASLLLVGWVGLVVISLVILGLWFMLADRRLREVVRGRLGESESVQPRRAWES